MFENEINYRVFVVGADCRDEHIVMVDRELEALLHFIVARPKERVTNASVIDEKTSETGAQVWVSRHFTHNLVKPIVLKDHRERVVGFACRSKTFLHVLQLRELLRFEVLNC